MSKASVSTGVFAAVYIGVNKVLGATKYSASGSTRRTLDTSEFGDTFDTFEYSTGDPGTITLTDVWKDNSDATGQAVFDQYLTAGTTFAIDEIKFMRDATSYYTIGTGGTLLVTKANAVDMERSGAQKCSFEFKLSGAELILRPNLVSIDVTPNAPTKAVGATQQFVATGTYSDASEVVLTAYCAWTSSDETKAVVSAGGLAGALATGTSVITATCIGISGTETLTIS